MDVQHDPRGQKFSLKFDDGLEAVLAYTHVNDIVDIHTVVVPEEHRGKGHGNELALAAFDYVRQYHMRVLPSCPFIKAFLEKHPELADIVAEGYY